MPTPPTGYTKIRGTIYFKAQKAINFCKNKIPDGFLYTPCDNQHWIGRSIEQISDRNPSLAASLAWLAKKDPDNWSDKKKIEITSIATIIPDSGRLTEDEWLAKYGNKANKLTQKKPIEATSVEVKPDETK